MADRPAIPAKPAPPLGLNEVHVCRADLQVSSHEFMRLEAALSGDERERAARFKFPELRRRYAATRGILRALLGSYLQLPPDQLRFEQNPHGKPFLAAADLRFNVSHAGELALLAFARGREVGVDVELIRPFPAGEAVAARCFTPGEVARLRALPAECRAEAFFAYWVRKEAVVKAIGRGVSFGLDRFEVPCLTDAAVSRPIPLHCPGDPTQWSLLPLDAGPGYVAALVAAGTDWTAHCRQWQPPDA
jgi:4'-phosphopantetheinyl transferase